jgi:hypothetical protein
MSATYVEYPGGPHHAEDRAAPEQAPAVNSHSTCGLVEPSVSDYLTRSDEMILTRLSLASP